MNAWSAERALLTDQNLINIKTRTQVRSPMNAWSAERASVRADTLINIKEFTQGRSPTNASSADRPLLTAQTFSNFIELGVGGWLIVKSLEFSAGGCGVRF